MNRVLNKTNNRKIEITKRMSILIKKLKNMIIIGKIINLIIRKKIKNKCINKKWDKIKNGIIKMSKKKIILKTKNSMNKIKI